VMPWATEKSESYREQLKKRDELASISPGAFKESKTGDRIYFVEGFDDLGYKVKNVFVQSIQHQKVGIITADTGSRYKAPNGDNFLVLENGRRYETTPNSAEVTTTDFERYDIRIDVKETAPEPSTTQSKSTSELFADATAVDSAEFQWRLAIPISAMILVLMAIPLSFVDPRAGRSLNVMFAVLIFIIYNNMLSIFQAWITQGKLSTSIGLWPVHFMFIAFTLYLFHRRNNLMPLMPAWLGAMFTRKSASK
jgi:lipopolysaccharide export system permease protein